MTVLTSAQTRSTSVVADVSAPQNACMFARAVLADWELSQLAEDACACLSELLTWLLANDPCVLFDITLVWDGPLLFVEASDRHERLPLRPAWLNEDSGRAVGLLESRSLEWGAETKALGRCVWASFGTGCPEVVNQEPE